MVDKKIKFFRLCGFNIEVRIKSIHPLTFYGTVTLNSDFYKTVISNRK